jgi:nucleoside-diphosphate-sugar epimerase
MRVFVTGATGFIGSMIVDDLIRNGHKVLGLSRSDSGAKQLTAQGAEVQRGELSDLEALRSAAAASDGVIHCGFDHSWVTTTGGDGFARFQAGCEQDRRAIEAMGDALAGSNRPLVVTAGIAARTEDEAPAEGPNRPPRVSEQTALAQVPRGVRAMVMRVPQVHDTEKQGLVTWLIALAAEKKVSAYVGEGKNRWAAIHRRDIAPLYRLALEKGTAGSRYHAVAEEGVTAREIAEAIGRGFKILVVSKYPEEVAAHFGWMAFFAGVDLVASGTLTQQRLGWRPTKQPSLIEDLNNATAFKGVSVGSAK